MLEIQKLLKKIGVEQTVNLLKIKVKEYSDYYLFKYDQIDSDFNRKETLEARGLVLDKNFDVLSYPFKKFFNYGESKAATIDWDSACVQQKVDGSLCTMWWNPFSNEWCVSTTGTAEAEGMVQDKREWSFATLFWETSKKYSFGGDVSFLNKNLNYIFELTSPYNIVVTPHGESGITLLSIRDRITLEEKPRSFCEDFANLTGIPIVKNVDLFTVDGIIESFSSMQATEEGYVVVDGQHNRIKIKNPGYVALHYLKSSWSSEKIMELVRSNEIEEFIAYFPERADEIKTTKQNYDNLVVSLGKLLETFDTSKEFSSFLENPSKENRKDCAVFIQNILTAENKIHANLFYSKLKNTNFTVSEYCRNCNIESLIESCVPKK